MRWTDEDYKEYVKGISEWNLNRTVAGLVVQSKNPSGDPRMIPILERFCADKRIANIHIPFRYGEIAYLAAFALCAEKHKLNLDGAIRITTAIPLPVQELHELAERYGAVRPRGLDGWVMLGQMLADMGKLPQMVLELDPAHDNGRIIMSEWLEPRHYGFNTDVEQLVITFQGRDER
ncbi:MAG TPA: hypothetical protein PLQ56_23880 [Aggregatilineales bacterium]|nr:hypothetical protein [Aggregatilineales bacterium]